MPPSPSPSLPTSEPSSQSYTTMSVGDVEAIGAHCQEPFCRVLDFLPFRCSSCHGTFCLDHRTETAHNCANPGAWARARASANAAQSASSSTPAPKPNITNHESQCSEPSCKTLVNTSLTPGVHCSTCRRDYCLKHRMAEAHDCAKLTPLGVAGAQKDRVNDALGRLRAWNTARKTAATASSASTKPQPTTSSSASASAKPYSSPALQRIISPFTSARKSSTATSQTLALNTLKRSAKGDAKIPPSSRIYLHLEAVAADREGSAGAKVPRAEAFYAAEWSVGKVLDAAARTLAVTNVNNRGGGEEERLRVFHVEGGRLLGFGEKLGARVKNGDTLVLLRGVGDPDGAV